MKKILLLALGLYSFIGYSQLDQKNEIKANLPYFVLGTPEISYERILGETSSLGISIGYDLEKAGNMEWRWIITPYYRLYFVGEKPKAKATGFFIEADVVALNQSYYNHSNAYDNTEYFMTNFGFGGAVGVKLLNNNGYFGEVFAGVTRVFAGNGETTMSSIFPRVGINIGKRF